eukprot:scaffold78806_cov35-Phaeocystis_antarctica.AAC.1
MQSRTCAMPDELRISMRSRPSFSSSRRQRRVCTAISSPAVCRTWLGVRVRVGVRVRAISSPAVCRTWLGVRVR